jgi:hypothetical protein
MENINKMTTKTIEAALKKSYVDGYLSGLNATYKEDIKNEPVAWAHHATFENLDSSDRSRFTATLSKKATDACCIPLFKVPQKDLVSLTDEEIQAALGIDASSSNWNLIKVLEWGNKIQAALLEKNK